MVLFAAIYIYFLIQMVMSSKWKDSLSLKEIKDKLGTVPSVVENWTKSVKNKISDESVIVIENAKKLTKKAWTALKQWKDFIVGKYNGLKTKINNTKKTSEKKVRPNESIIDEKLVWELVKTNKKMIDLTKKLIDKYPTSSICMFSIINLSEINEDYGRNAGLF